MKTALILVDIQNDYFPGGKNELFEPLEAANRARLSLALFRENGWPVFHIRHISNYEGATFFLPDTLGSQIHQTVAPLENEPVIIKHAPDSFHQTDLKERLDKGGVARLVICGMMSHMCIDTTVRRAKGLGYEVLLIHDACTTKDLVWEGEHIPAQTVHSVYMASLNGSFAKLTKQSELYTNIPIKSV